MKNLIALISLVLMVAGIAAAAEKDLSTGRPGTDVESGFVSLDSGNVLWDISHGVYYDYQPSGRFSIFAELLALAGNSITVSDQGVENIDLSHYCVLVIAFGAAEDPPYTAGEVEVITTYVENGGGLLVLADNPRTFAGPRLNPVTQAFGTTITESHVYPVDLFSTDLAAHEIFSGVNEINFTRSAQLTAIAPSVEVAWSDNEDVLVTVVEPHKVVITGDANFCDNNHIGAVDNTSFALNVFAWLCSGPVGIESKSWSGVKAMFR